MNELIDNHTRQIEELDCRFDRITDIDWNDRLIGVTGARGVGKTTYLLNHIKNKLSKEAKAIYVSLDDIYFSSHSLVEFAGDWLKRGGTHLFLDEIHKYPNWSQELKNIYDRYKKLNVVFTGSSLLHIYSGKADLSRRAVVYTMNGLSFREFMQIETGKTFSTYTLNDIIENHEAIAKEIVKEIRPLAFFEDYLEHGYYPFYLESKTSYHRKLMNTINLMLEVDLPYLRHVEVKYIHKLKKLINFIANAVPYQPNVSKLAGDIEVARNTVMLYLNYLEDSKIINLLHSKSSSDAHLAKPEKIFLHHPNIIYAINKRGAETGTIRESFFYNQVNNIYDVKSSPVSDFLVEGKYTFEVGGKNKSKKQLKNIKNSFVAADNIEYGNDTTIPLWLFGFLY
ncbi:MAG: AAA family ATPase [Brumimicrobium sp.]